MAPLDLVHKLRLSLKQFLYPLRHFLVPGNIPTLILSTIALVVAVLLRYGLSFKRLLVILNLQEVPLQETQLQSNTPATEQLKRHPAIMETRFIDGIAERLFPNRPCLTAAVAARLLLRIKRFDSILVLGVRKTESNELVAHAWLKTIEHLVVAGRYQPLSEYKVIGIFNTRDKSRNDENQG